MQVQFALASLCKRKNSRLTHPEWLTYECCYFTPTGKSGMSKLTVSVHLIDHVLKFSLCGVLSQRPHDGAKFFGGDGAVAILVE